MADFQENISEFSDRGIAVVAASVDPLEDAQESIAELGLTFPIGYGLDYMGFATKTGAYYEIRRQILHATGFIIKPNGEVQAAVYSTVNIGRYRAEDCLRYLDFVMKQS